jgi:hypothetical protein
LLAFSAAKQECQWSGYSPMVFWLSLRHTIHGPGLDGQVPDTSGDGIDAEKPPAEKGPDEAGTGRLGVQGRNVRDHRILSVSARWPTAGGHREEGRVALGQLFTGG